MDILQLRYFYDSANYLSISKTAEKYGVPSTSVSASIRRLEKELGCKLFDRTPNRISLNDKGIIMRDSLKKIFSEMDSMIEAVSGSVDDVKEIKILVKAIRALITEQVIEYKKKYAQTRFKLVADFDERDIDDYDIIIDTKSDQYIGYDSLELVNQQVCCYVLPDSGLCKRTFSLKELSQMSFVLMSQHGNHGKVFIEACKKEGFTPNIVAQVNDSACFRRIISSGIAIGVTGQLATNVDGNITMVPLDIKDFKYKQTICMYYKKDNSGNSARFVSFLRDNVKNDSI
jgi:LysR family transcriptional activator of glutamate synthase operon